MPCSGRRLFIAWLVMAAFLVCAGCVPLAEAPAPAPVVKAKKQGVLGEDRWLDAAHGIYWLNLTGCEPEWPLAEQDFVFGWQKGELVARLWVLPASGDLAVEAIGLAQRQGWALAFPRRIAWQGRPARDAYVSDQIMAGRLRLLKTEDNLLAVAALAPADKAEVKAPELAAMIEGLRLLPPGDLLHTVRHPAETLSVVAMWYTGTVRNWPLIQDYNKLDDPKLNLGQDILIPARLVWRWDPLPGWVVRLVQAPKDDGDKAKEGPSQGKALELELLPAGPK